MFSLIITIISIALVAALAIATIYYGGSAFTKGSAKAAADTLINAGQQINGAVTIAKSDAVTIASIADLTTGSVYLQGAPGVPSGASAFQLSADQAGAGAGTAYATSANVTAEICAEVTTLANGNGVYGCSGTTFWFKL